MVAYNFKGQFKAPIKRRTKRQTIRAVGKRRHAKPGQELQLYIGMRTPRCELVLRAKCKSVDEVRIHFSVETTDRDFVILYGDGGSTLSRPVELHAFARRDGFESWAELRAFWRHNHPGVNNFKGVLIQW